MGTRVKVQLPVPIDRAETRRLAARFDEAMDIIANEFTALDTHQQYRNPSSRLLKWDPLGRVLMLGTDQRDLFVPELSRARGDFAPKRDRCSTSAAATVRRWHLRLMLYLPARDFKEDEETGRQLASGHLKAHSEAYARVPARVARNTQSESSGS